MPIAGGPGSPIYPGTPPGVTAKLGSGNIYGDQRQCTWYADERYHQLTGYWVPWAADARGWLAGAQQSGWDSASQPPNAPSIIVLQPGVQMADPVYGHVGVVEKVNPDGSVTTSDLNWGPTPSARSAVSTVVFRTGPGVDFVWVGVGGLPAQGSGTMPGQGTSTASAAAAAVSAALVPGADLASSFVAMDAALIITNPFDVSTVRASQQQAGNQGFDWSSAPSTADPAVWAIWLGQQSAQAVASAPSTIGGLPNPVAWLDAVLTNLFFDATAMIVRGLFLFLGAAILLKVASAFIDWNALGETAQSGAEAVKALIATGILA